MRIRALSTFCCMLFLVGIAFAQESPKPLTSSSCAAGKKTGCCLDSKVCNKTQYCDENCQCTRKKPAAISSASVQPVAVPAAIGTRTGPSEPIVSTAGNGSALLVASQSDNKFRSLRADGVNLDRLDAASFNEDCGVDKGKCSSGSFCCRVGGSGWCCPNGKKCDYDTYGCK